MEEVISEEFYKEDFGIYIIYKMMANLIWEKESGEKHYEDDLVKYVCYGCDKEFIVGKHFAETSDQLRCPYCGQIRDLDVKAEVTGEWLEELELGCFGISYTIDNNGNHVTHPLELFEKEVFYNRQNMTDDEINKRYIQLVQQIN